MTGTQIAVLGLRFSANSYRADEGIDFAEPVRIIKDANIRLAHPVVFRVSPLTVQQALDLDIVTDDDFPPDDPFLPTRASKLHHFILITVFMFLS